MNKKEQILELLDKEGELAETKIAIKIKSNNGYTNRYLEELKKEKKVILRKEKTTTSKVRNYWRINK